MRQIQTIHVLNCTYQYFAEYCMHRGFNLIFTYLQSPGNPIVLCPYSWRYCCGLSYTPRFRL